MIATALTALTASANLQSSDYYQAKLTSWSAEFGACESAQAFADNDDIISTHNAGNSTFTLGHNQFSCLTNEQFVARYLDNAFVARAPGATGNEIHYFNESEPLADAIDW